MCSLGCARLWGKKGPNCLFRVFGSGGAHQVPHDYKKWAGGFSVLIPKHLIGYDSSAGPHHGFNLILSEDRTRSIFVNGEANTLGFKESKEQAAQQLKYLQQQGEKIESVKTTPRTIGSLPATEIVIVYSSPKSNERYIQDSVLALGPRHEPSYEVTLRSSIDHFHADHAVLLNVLKTWKYTGY
jgi:hypothetical protein